MRETGRYANIIIDISHEKVDKTFQYKVPVMLEDTLEAGMCVHVPFGAGNHLRKGYVIERTEQAEFPPERMKEIAAIVKDGVSVEADAIRLAAWMKKTYGCTMIAALKTVLPVALQLHTIAVIIRENLRRSLPLFLLIMESRYIFLMTFVRPQNFRSPFEN